MAGWAQDKTRRVQVFKIYAPGMCSGKLQEMKRTIDPEEIAETMEPLKRQ